MQQVDDPPYLSVGTEVSAKYKGAFCEAKVRKVVRNIKCKVAYKQGLGTGTVSDDQIKCDLLRVGATVEVKHPDRREFVEATITKIQDYSQYTVVFDDGDITTLRRSALCLKSGRHFNESETLDQLPLTHPEHFGNPVIGGRRGRSLELYKKNIVRSRHTPDESSDEDEEIETKPRIIEKEEHIGKIVCVESNDTKKKGPKENWFPALVVAPTAQDTVRIRVKDEYLVRSFKDGRYYTVPKKEATEFTREQASKQDTVSVQAALEYMHNDCLPPHWDREVLFGLGNSLSDFYNEFESDTSDDEPTEEKDHFVAQLYKYMDDRGTPLNKGPSIINKDVDLYRLYRAVQKLGGYNRVTTQNQWKQIAIRLGFVPTTTSIQNLVKQAYKKFLLPFEEFDRKLGCTMVAHPRANRIKGRSLVRANSVASPKPEKESKSTTSAAEESENTSESGVDTAKPKTKSKVKSLIDQYEEKLDEVKREQKDLKEQKELKIPKESGRELRDKESIPSTSVKSLESLGSRKDKLVRRQIISSADEKKGKKRIVKENENEKIKCEPYEKEKIETIDVPINVGDKLRVYYHEQKVTYEAKVIEISKDENALYLVHYTGWNTRYDEWVPKERIAENLTNNKSNKRLKGGNKAETRSHSSTSDKIAGPSPLIRSSSKRNRVGSKNDIDQHPRSTTPSSIASNSSRTKSPATPAQHRRTTRGQPNKLRRTSNNTDISSLQTDSDSDSDEPVVKKPTPKRRSVTAKSKSRRLNAIEISEEIKKEKYSNASSEEEPLANAVAKSKELLLSQISSELKGFNEVKKVSTDTPSTSTHTLLEKKIDYIPKTEPKSPSCTAQSSHQLSAANKSIQSGIKTKFKTENSSDSDSFGDDDSNHLEICKTTGLAINKSANNELIDKVATLKQSGIEKIIKTTLAEKPKGLPEKPSMRTLIERTPLKHLDGDKQTEVSDNYPDRVLFSMKCHTKIGSEQEDIEKSSTKDNDEQILKIESDDHMLTEKTRISIDKRSIDSVYDVTAAIENCPASSSSVISKNDIDDPIIISSLIKVESSDTTFTKTEKQKGLNKPSKLSVIISKDQSNSDDDSEIQGTAAGDIYEFKEPEPFEFEASKKTSPETDKKSKRKVQTEKSESTKRCPTPPLKRNKKITNKDAEKGYHHKIEEESEQSIILETIPITDPIKTEPISEEPELSDNQLIDNESLQSDDKKSDKQDAECPSTTVGVPIASTSEAIRETQPAVKSLFINTFVEATIEDQSKVFELKAVKYTKSKPSPDEELESVKKIMLTDEVLNQEPPKIDKPSSIADKVLKALSSQQHSINSPEATTIDPENPEVDAHQSHISTKPPSERSSSPSTTLQAVEGSSPTNSEQITKSQKTTPLTTRVLDNEVQSSMKSISNKIDILESISPKNNDLSETIQKLESVIQKTGDQSHMSDDSTDSTDSEQRLIIEDESQGLETTPEFVLTKHEADGAKEAHKDVKLILTSKCTTSAALITLVSNTSDLAPNTVNISGTEKQESVNPSVIESVAFTKRIETTESKKFNKSDQTDDHAVDVKLEDNNDIQNDESEVVQNESLSLFLCEETIPGSPAPACPKEQSESSKKGFDNLFTSPNAIESDARLVSIETETKHIQKPGDKSATPASSPRDSMSQDESSEDINKKPEQDRIISPKKRRTTRKQSELESISKRRKPIPRRNTITGSDSEDNSDMNATQRLQRPSKTCQYNFLVQLDPAMNSNQRIALLKKKIQDLRKTYNMIKTELASIDRRRKKLRRREREMKKNAQQNLQSQQSTDQPSVANQHVHSLSQTQQSETRANVPQS